LRVAFLEGGGAWGANFYFGNEADDRTVAAAFNTKVNPLGVKVNALWSSDSGHWDVPDITDVLADSRDLVEEGVITADDSRRWCTATRTASTPPTTPTSSREPPSRRP
jgi:hypothetical protein